MFTRFELGKVAGVVIQNSETCINSRKFLPTRRTLVARAPKPPRSGAVTFIGLK